MEQAMQSAAASQNISLPKSPEELDRFKQEYPDVFEVVETIATMKAQERSSGLEQELEVIREREKELKVQSAYRELTNNHPDFNEIKADEEVLSLVRRTAGKYFRRYLQKQYRCSLGLASPRFVQSRSRYLNKEADQIKRSGSSRSSVTKSKRHFVRSYRRQTDLESFTNRQDEIARV
jgi:hypothetical protein